MRPVIAFAVLVSSSVVDARPGMVVGIVTRDQAGVAGATIRWVIDGRDPVYVTTDREGKYHVALEPGAWSGSVSIPDQPPRPMFVTVIEGHDTACDVRLPALTPNYEMIEGSVRAAGVPVIGARVDVFGPTGGFSSDSATTTALTDERGRYRLALVEFSRHAKTFDVEVHAPGFAPSDRHFVTGWDKAGDVELRAGAAITGVVRTSTGAPVPHGRIDVTRKTPLFVDDSGPTRTIETDEHGQFVMPDLRASTYVLHVANASDVLVVLGDAEHVSIELVAPTNAAPQASR